MKRIILPAAAATLIAGIAAAQVLDRPVAPGTTDLPGDSPSPLAFPGERSGRWLVTPGDTYALRLEGTVESVTPDRLLVGREGEPDALVTLRPETLFFYRGEAVTFDAIPQGARVLAEFDLAGQERIASRVEAVPQGEPFALRPTAPPIAPEVEGLSGDVDTVMPPASRGAQHDLPSPEPAPAPSP